MYKLSFNEEVYEVVKLIPEGKVTSYGAIARYLGKKNWARLVGYAMNGVSKKDENIPAHRVVNSKGILSGKEYFVGENSLEQLLNNEGIKVENNKIVDLKLYYWDPNVELDLEK